MRMLKPQLPPKQQVEIQGAGPPALLARTVATAALLQKLHFIQQLECRRLRRRTLHSGDQKNGVAVFVLTLRSAKRLGLQKLRTAHILSICIAPLHEEGCKARNNPTQSGFRRPMAAAQIGPEPNGKR